MGGLNVKNTIVEQALRIIAPHPCYGCGKIGAELCHHCKYDIISEPFLGCFLCGLPSLQGICLAHISPLERVFVVNRRDGALEAALNALKFSRAKGVGVVMAELLDTSLPLLPSNVIIVPIPTIRPHIRQRGYDQVALIARSFAASRGLPYVAALRRASNTVQHTVGREERQTQARAAFGLNRTAVKTLKSQQSDTGELPIVLLIDDIITTGATLSAAAQLLKDAGFTVWAAALAYQPLD